MGASSRVTLLSCSGLGWVACWLFGGLVGWEGGLLVLRLLCLWADWLGRAVDLFLLVGNVSYADLRRHVLLVEQNLFSLVYNFADIIIINHKECKNIYIISNCYFYDYYY